MDRCGPFYIPAILQIAREYTKKFLLSLIYIRIFFLEIYALLRFSSFFVNIAIERGFYFLFFTK